MRKAVAIITLAALIGVTPEVSAPTPMPVGWTRPAPAPRGLRPITLHPPEDALPLSSSALALHLALLEWGLGEMAGVVPQVAGAPLAPGLAAETAWPYPAEPWSAALRVEMRPVEPEAPSAPPPEAPAPEASASPEAEPPAPEPAAAPEPEPAPYLVLRLKDPRGFAHTLSTPLTPDPRESVAALLPGLARLLSVPEDGRPSAPLPPALLGHDAYARAMAGRSAAILYGLAPPASRAERGDPRRDPVHRAPFLDPSMALGHWLLARQCLALGDVAGGTLSLGRAAHRAPASPFARGAAGTLLEASGRPAAALAQLRAISAQDPRFVLTRARAAQASGDWDALDLALGGLPEQTRQGDPRVARLLAELAEARGGAQAIDAAYGRWQGAAPQDPEPVRRRLGWRIRQRDFKGALSLLPALAQRGAEAEAARLKVALAAQVGRWDLAAEAALALGDAPLAERLRHTEDRLRPRAADALAPVGGVPGRLNHAESLMERQQLWDAFAVVNGVLAGDAYQPDALYLRHRIQRRLGQPRSADESLARLRRADPYFLPERP